MKPIDYDKIAESLKCIMRWRGLSQSKVARSANIHRPRLTDFLNRRVNLTDSDIEKILKVIAKIQGNE